MGKKVIQVKNLVKKYKDFEAVKDISFDVEEGTLFAFLGVNGAGKSTSINIISTLLKKTSGEIKVCDYTLDKEDELIRKNIGVVFQDNVLDKQLTIEENMVCRGQLYGMSKKEIYEKIETLSKEIDTVEFMDRKYGNLSGGQKRRADILRALLNSPRILILDEPTTGLDPSTRKKVWATINKLKEEKKLTVFLTTHYMEEARLADNILVLSKGQIVANGTPDSLRREFSSDRLIVTFKNESLDDIISYLKEKKLNHLQDRDRVIISLKNSLEAITYLNDFKDKIDDFELIRGNLDDAFININRLKGEENANN